MANRFHFELVIRGKTRFEASEDPGFSIPCIEVSGIPLLKANDPESGFSLPFINREYVRYWIGTFLSGEGSIEVRDVMVLKVEGFGRYPKLTKPHNRAKNRVFIANITKSQQHEPPVPTHVPHR